MQIYYLHISRNFYVKIFSSSSSSRSSEVWNGRFIRMKTVLSSLYIVRPPFERSEPATVVPFVVVTQYRKTSLASGWCAAARSPENASECSRHNGIANSCRIYALLILLSSWDVVPARLLTRLKYECTGWPIRNDQRNSRTGFIFYWKRKIIFLRKSNRSLFTLLCNF